MKILIMGAGAVGAYFGARLQETGEDVVFCSRGENLRVLKERGLEVESPSGALALKVRATGEPRDFAPYELILFCVKAYDTEAAARALDGCLAAGGAILTLQNGVENEARLCQLFGKEAVMGGNARVGVRMAAPGKVVHSTSGIIEFGELDGRETARAVRFAEAFRRAGILGELTMRISVTRWDKLLWNGAFNTVSALTRCRVGEILDDPEGLALVRTIMKEIVTVARAEGVELGEERIEALLNRSRTTLRDIKTSTLQDLERGKPLEYDALAGAVVRAARRHGISVPASETMYALLKMLDWRSR